MADIFRSLRRRAAALCVSLVAGSTAFAAPSDVLPDGAIGDRLRDYVLAINSTDPAPALRYATEDMSAAFAQPAPPPAVRQYFADQHRVTGGVTPIGFRFDAGSSTTGVLALRDTIYGGVRAIAFVFDDTPKHQVLDLNPVPAPAWAVNTAARRSPAEIGAYAKALIARGCRADVFSGAFLVAHNGRVLMQAACGEADARDHRRNTVDTRINLGSINKAFTAVAIEQLIEHGKVSPTDKLSAYVGDDWLPTSIGDQITIDQLLSMTSGLTDYFDTYPMSHFATLRTLDAYKPAMRAQTLHAKPGATWEYNDTNYFLLGLVVQKASGEPYHDYIRRHIYAPAGMSASDSYPQDEAAAHDLAIGYTYAGGADPWRANIGKAPLVGMADGGGYSTVGDMLRFVEALQAGKLVGRAALARLWTAHPSTTWGRGFYVFDAAAGKIVGKDGFGPGISSEFDVYADKGYVVIALSNHASGALAPMDAMRAEIAGAR